MATQHAERVVGGVLRERGRSHLWILRRTYVIAAISALAQMAATLVLAAVLW